MRERVQAFNGDIKIESSLGSGTLITADMQVVMDDVKNDV
jgi:signal transduction histidine kinase